MRESPVWPDQQPEGDLSSNSPSKPFSGGARAEYGATGHRHAPGEWSQVTTHLKVFVVEDLEIPKKSKSIPTRHLDIQDMNQTALTRAKKIRVIDIYIITMYSFKCII